MNSAPRNAVGAQREFWVKISPNGYHVEMYPKEPPNVRFSAKGGSVSHMPLTRLLMDKGVQMPALYTMR